MERPEVVDPLKEEEQPILQQTPVEEPESVDTQTDDAFSVRGLAEKRLGKVGATALDFVPIIGDVLAAEDVAKSYKEGDTLGTAVNSLALAAGLIPVIGDVAAKGMKAGLKAARKAEAQETASKFVDEVGEAKTAKDAQPVNVSPNSKTVTAYKLFKTDKEGKLYPLFVPMSEGKDIPIGKWIAAESGEMNVQTGKVKAGGMNLAYRPGFHAGDIPLATHIGGKMDLNTGKRLKGRDVVPSIREENQVWAEVEMLDDVDWQSVANSRASIVKSGPNKGKLNSKEAHITDQLPKGGHYRYKTNPNMTGNWLIGGELKVNKILSSAEVKAINDKAGVADLPKLSDLGLQKFIDKISGIKPSTAPKAPIAPTPKARGGAIRTYKEGGVVPMQEQMNFAFMNEGGVLADDGVDRDPVSGNEVPAGSMAEEVRDDVPAMLSEGEYVVPADVVRYHGIDKFEQLRDEAKMGLQRMEADGRIGGQPVEEQEEFPFPVEELEGFQEGGTVGDIYPDVMGQPFTPGQRYPSSDRFPGVGFELRNFTNPTTGKTVVIPFFNGNPMQFIPPDFLEGGASTTRGGTFDPASDERDRQEREAELARGTGRGMSDLAYDAAIKAIQGVETGPKTKPFSEYSADDFRNYLAQRKSGLGRVMDAIPVVGLLTSMQDNAAREFARKSLIQGKNIVTGEALTNNEAGVLMEVADMPRGKSILETIDDFLQGKTPRSDGIVIDDTVPIDTELRRTTYEPQERIDTQQDVSKLYGDRGFTPETIGEDPQQQYYGPPGEFQNIIERQTGQTVSQQAKEIIDNAEQERIDKLTKADKDFVNKVKKIKELPRKALDKAIDLFGVTGLGNLDQKIFSTAGAQTTTNSELLNRLVASGKYDADDIATLNQFHVSEASVPFDKLDESPTVPKKDGKFTVYEDTEGFLTAGPGVKILADDGGELPKVSEMSSEMVNYYKSKVYDGEGLQRALLKVYDEKKADVERIYGEDLAQYPPDVKAVVKRTLIDMNMQIKNGTSGFNMMNKAIKEGNLGEAAKQITGNYVDADGNASFSTAPGAKKVSNTKYFNQMSGSKKDVLTDGNRAFRHALNLEQYKNWQEGVEQIIKPSQPEFVFDYGFGTEGLPKSGVDQTYVPPQAPTADDIRLAGGIDAFAKQQAAPIIPKEPDPLQDLPVGVSIEADGQFTGTGGLGAVQAPRVRTPIVKRDFLDPNIAMSRREELSDPSAFRGPTGAGLGPMMTDDEKTALDLAKGYSDPYGGIRFQERGRPDIDPSQLQPSSASAVDQTESMLGDVTGTKSTLPRIGETATQPVTAFTPLGKPSDISRLMPSAGTQRTRLGLSPGAMGGRQLGMSPGAMGGRAIPTAKEKEKPAEEVLSKSEYEKRVKDARSEEYAKAREDADRARDSVLRQGGSVQEAFDAAQTAFTGFTPSGEFVGATDPGTAAMNRFSKGGLASKSKKTKPKKRNIKKGLGGRMAT